MALTITFVERTVDNAKTKTRGTMAFDSSYPTGGEAFTARGLGLLLVDELRVYTTGGVVFETDLTNKKVLAYVPGVEVGAGGAGTLDDFPLAGVAASTVSIGMTAGSTTHRFGVMKEVADTTDLSAITGVRWEAVGA